MKCLFHGDDCWIDGVDAKMPITIEEVAEKIPNKVERMYAIWFHAPTSYKMTINRPCNIVIPYSKILSVVNEGNLTIIDGKTFLITLSHIKPVIGVTIK